MRWDDVYASCFEFLSKFSKYYHTHFTKLPEFHHQSKATTWQYLQSLSIPCLMSYCPKSSAKSNAPRTRPQTFTNASWCVTNERTQRFSSSTAILLSMPQTSCLLSTSPIHTHTSSNSLLYVALLCEGMLLILMKLDRVYKERLVLLPPIIASLTNLSTFSAYVLPGAHSYWHFEPELLISIVEALPESCVNLELDLRGHNQISYPRSSSSPHLCDSLRHILPRMRQVRLVLSTTCSTLFEDGAQLASKDENESESTSRANFISLPRMETLLVSCTDHRDLALRSGLCGQKNKSAWNSVTNTLQRLVKQEIPVKKPRSC